MKALKDKVNTVPPGGDYPYGDLRDNPGDNSGTPVNRDLLGDIHRTVEKIMDEAGIVANGLDDNEANGYQIYEAMIRAIRGYDATTLWINSADTGNEVTILNNELGLDFNSFINFEPGGHIIVWNNPSLLGDSKVQIMTNSNNSRENYRIYKSRTEPGVGTGTTILIRNANDTGAYTGNFDMLMEIRRYH